MAVPDHCVPLDNAPGTQPRRAAFEVALSAAMGLESGKNVVWWCPSLTLRVSISR